MKTTTVVPFAGRLLIAASIIGPFACGGNAAGPDAPNPLGVPDTVVFSFQSGEVLIGDTLRLSVVARDAGGNAVPNVVLVWQSFNPAVATVSADGLVTTHDIGEAEIEVEATVPGSSMALFVDSSQIGTTALRPARSRVKIVSVPNVAITPTEATINVKQSHQFTVRVTKKGGGELPSRPVIKWTSSNPAVATVNSGVAVAVAAGTTQITAAVTVGSSFKEATAKLTVRELACGGIASVQTLYGRFSYKYVAGGLALGGVNRISSEYSGDVKATMTRQSAVDPEIPLVIWVGPLSGSATQDEKEFDRSNKELQRLEGAGPPVNDVGLAYMYVEVDQRTCRYRVIVEVKIDLKWTFNGRLLPWNSGSARLRVGSDNLLLRAGELPSFPVAVDLPFAGHTANHETAHPDTNAFIPRGLATRLFANPGASEGAIGEALVDYHISRIPFVNFDVATIATQRHGIGASIPQSAAADAFHSRRRLR